MYYFIVTSPSFWGACLDHFPRESNLENSVIEQKLPLSRKCIAFNLHQNICHDKKVNEGGASKFLAILYRLLLTFSVITNLLFISTYGYYRIIMRDINFQISAVGIIYLKCSNIYIIQVVGTAYYIIRMVTNSQFNATLFIRFWKILGT